ncbi:f-box domain-containing protein [Rutstroemia sp. NJR-2017a BBW]|nr:f-box domain-containing protein [Rutstroemia sp. NJR-2017a BBW]
MDSLKPIERLPDEVLYRILQLVVHEDYCLGPRASSPWASPEVPNFCLVQKRFKRAYDLRSPPPILRLSNEILENIFENLVQNSGKLIPIDHRASLSVESFQSMPPQTVEDTNITMNLSCTHRRFRDILHGRQFARIAIRFSQDGFDRLNWLLNRPHLVPHVKKFSYMIPVFYFQGMDHLQNLLEETQTTTVDIQRQLDQRRLDTNARLNDRSMKQLRAKLDRSQKDESTIFRVLSRAREQRTIIHNQLDIQTLLRAFRTFVNLQQIRLMRVQDIVDIGWASFLRNRRWDAFQRNTNMTDPILSVDLDPLEWTVACEHSARTLGYAFLQSNSPATRFSSRFVNPRMPFLLNRHSQATISSLANRLTCLEIQVQEPTDDKLHQLSTLFETLFTNANKIQGLHVGFPTHRPLSHVPLEAVFHNVCWENLRYVGFGAWHLESDEIINLLRRHRTTLRSVRLRSVKLKEGSSWLDIVRMVRLELKDLKWVSFRGVGYVTPTVEVNNNVGGFVPQEIPDDDEDSSDDESEYEEDTAIGDRTLSHHSSSAVLNTPVRDDMGCACGNGYGFDDLKDVGRDILKHHWKYWELWAVKRCAVHDPHM